jgi:hypothetical protein
VHGPGLVHRLHQDIAEVLTVGPEDGTVRGQPEASGHHDVLPDEQGPSGRAPLATADLFDEQPRRDWARVVSGEVCGAVS